MTNFATALKTEIVQVAQKTLRDEAQSLRKAAATYDREIAALQRRLENLEQLITRLRSPDSPPARRPYRTTRTAGHRGREASPIEGPALRFSAKGFTKLRKRLGLSAAAMGDLLGVTAQSIYKWEDGKAHPRPTQLQAIAAVRKLGKREAAARLASMEPQADLQEEAQEATSH